MPIKEQQLPDKNNFYASFQDVNKRQIKEALENNGWCCRKVSWSDFELTNDWSELVLEGDEEEPLLMAWFCSTKQIWKYLIKLLRLWMQALFTNFMIIEKSFLKRRTIANKTLKDYPEVSSIICNNCPFEAL